ncbi:UPF0179 family protein [Methanocaldococcus fervens]|uniref:UPF0179 protein Mefer_1322 n=1 Tax=Methanocaldococcus fervens (strain DSM 4213 / JCM 15782 / AG86) TaxID=573064 RepID=C7P999_METFA|nr:UPF0179 family protein [Methanocaldococcus fervens]ACV25131.1 Protein of unknown function UPF0179 [Methanocaldococcus fervens AG86]
MSKESKITLIGSKLAKTGGEFVYLGEIEECKNCKFRRLCHGNLEVGRKYKIISVRSANHPCTVHEGGVKVVEVVLADLTIMIESKKALEGVILNHKPINCENFDCEYYNFCNPDGIMEGEKYKIKQVLNEKINCPNGKSLKKVVIEIVEDNNTS